MKPQLDAQKAERILLVMWSDYYVAIDAEYGDLASAARVETVLRRYIEDISAALGRRVPS